MANAVDDYAKGITGEITDALLLSQRARAYEALNKWEAAGGRLVTGRDQESGWRKLLAEFARRLAAGGESSLAKAQFDKSQDIYERLLETDSSSDSVAAELAQVLVDRQALEGVTLWTVLKPIEAKSDLGETLSILPDDSILVSGVDALNDRYRVVLNVGKDVDVAAVRLEAFSHPSLPGNGPGRNPVGSFSQVSWDVTARTKGRGDAVRLEFDHAWADYEFAPYPIRTNGHWNIYGGQGRDLTAIWTMSHQLSLSAETTMTFEMQCQGSTPSGGGEGLGRFRLWVSGDPDAIAWAQRRLTLMKITDPWAKLAAAYHFIGDQKALDKVVNGHPAATAGLGDLYAADKNWERAIAAYRQAITDQTTDDALLTKLATTYKSAGRTAMRSRISPRLTPPDRGTRCFPQEVGGLQAWFGQKQEFAATRAATSSRSRKAPTMRKPRGARRLFAASCRPPTRRSSKRCSTWVARGGER